MVVTVDCAFVEDIDSVVVDIVVLAVVLVVVLVTAVVVVLAVVEAVLVAVEVSGTVVTGGPVTGRDVVPSLLQTGGTLPSPS